MSAEEADDFWWVFRCTRCTTSIATRELFEHGKLTVPCPSGNCSGDLVIANNISAMVEQQLEEEAREPLPRQEDPRLWRMFS